jgi:site-specific recombinase XerD
MENSISVLFYLRKSIIRKKTEAPIYMRITVNGSRVDLSTHQFTLDDKWDVKHGQVKGPKSETHTVNNTLDNLRSKVNKIFTQLETMGKPITAEIIRNTLEGKSINRRSLVEAFKLYNEQLKPKVGHGYAKATLVKYQVTCNKVEDFIRFQYNRSDVFLDELDYQFTVNFELYLKTHDFNIQNTVSKHVTLLKKIINYCLANNWLEKNPFINFKCPYKDPERHFLTKDELETLQSKAMMINRLAVVRDMYVFSCYTGIPFADMENLIPSDVSIGIDGDKWIIFNRIKNGSRSPVPLLPVPLSIIEKYKDYPVNSSKGKLLPMYSNQRVNGYLKEIATICGIEKTLTFHTARHTFATTVTLTNGVPIETVSKMLGHTSIKTTQIYSKVVDVKISHDMKVLKEKIAAVKEVTPMAKVVNQ